MATTATKRRPTRQRQKSAQLVIRISPEQKSLLEEAAIASGRTVTDLVTEAAREKALQIAREDEELTLWRLSRADATAFVAACLDPAEPSERMRRDYAAYRTSMAERFVPTPDPSEDSV